MARALAVALLLGGCDAVFLTEHRACVDDPFTTLTSWNITPPPTPPNAVIANATLVLPYRGGLDMRSEVVFKSVLDFTDARASVRVVATPIAQLFTYSYFGLAKDATNFHLFRLGSRNNVDLALDFVAVTNSVESSIGELPFDPVLFRRWRFAHVPATNMIEMQTSDTGEDDQWTTRFAAPPIGDVKQFAFVLGAIGGFGGEPSAAFDDFSVCTF